MTTTLTTVALVAQGNPFGGLIGTAKGLIAVLVAGLLSLAVGWATAIMIWRLLESMFKDPSLGKLAGIVASLCVAVGLVGAAPGFVSSSYSYGQQIGSGTGAGIAPADVTTAGTGQ